MNATNKIYKRKAQSLSSSTSRGTAANTTTANGTSTTSIKSGSNPTTLQINNIAVHFPFKPYDVQTKYMESVLDALQGGKHALLESPTGTGKTLCLLCSTLAWQQAQKGLVSKADATAVNNSLNNGGQTQAPAQAKAPVIIYASRTHSQLSQVVREMKNTRYRPRHAVLGSREHMCIHPKVNPLASPKSKSQPTSSDVNHSCNKLNKERKCIYRNTLDERGSEWHPPCSDQTAGDENQPVRDMEDLVSVGKQHRICPFYYTRGLISTAEIIFVPYNYLFDRDARESTLAEVDFANAILIFDEAHNLEEFASESSSFDLSSNDVAGCVGEVQRALQYLELNPDDGGGGKLKDNMLRLKSIFLKLEQYLLDGLEQNAKVAKGAGATGESSHSGDFIFDIFREGAGITHANSTIFNAFVRQVQELIMEFKGSGSSSATPKLDHFVNCLKRVYGTGTEMLALARSKSYRVHVTKVNGNTGGGFTGGRTISYWCFAPALAMRELSFLKVRSILITSGTLSPLPSFSMELGLDFPVQLENKHVIQPDQIFVRVIGKGVSGKQLSSKFGRRDDPEYILELGNTIASLSRNIPGGVLIFFPSYSSMQTCIERWGGPSNHKKANEKGGQFFAARKKPQPLRYSFPQMPTHFMAQGETSTPWKRLLSRKAIVLEPRSTSDLNDAIAEFKKFISLPKSPGCILMGVCRGKISEGIDFNDEMCRCVIVTGLPFAPYLDPKVKLKREFLDTARASERTPSSIDGGFGNKTEEKPKSSMTLSGAEWYNQQAHRAVNQAIGRVIRHRNDYGAVLFLDHRFSESRNREGLSKWLRPYLLEESFGASTRSLVQFYKDARAKTTTASLTRPVLKYEDSPEAHTPSENQITQIAVVSSAVNEDNTSTEFDTFIPESRIQKRIDINNPATEEGDEPLTANTDVNKNSAKTLAQAYVKNAPNQSLSAGEKSSIWDSLDPKEQSSTSSLLSTANMRPLKRQPTLQSRNKENAKEQAKRFFDTAKQLLQKDDLLKSQQLLVTMKTHGDKKASQAYINTAKELLLLLIGAIRNDRKRMKLISLLFPLMPVKFRYTIEKMGARLCFEKSAFWSNCKSSMSGEHCETIQKILPPLLIYQGSSPHPSVVDAAPSDKTLLEDLCSVIKILRVNGTDDLNQLFDFLPERLSRKAQAVNIEITKEREITKAKERSSRMKGEKCINPVLFQRTQPKVFGQRKNTDPTDEPDAENLSQALSQGKAIICERKSKIIAMQNCSRDNKRATSDNQPISKRVCRSVPQKVDAVESVLNKVKQDAYQPRLERLNGRIKANVPKNFTCSLCNTHPKEPLRAKCGHSACIHCWKDWLGRQNTCPHCRKHTEMKSLEKMIFKNDEVTEDAGFTQVCESESDTDELEIVAR